MSFGKNFHIHRQADVRGGWVTGKNCKALNNLRLLEFPFFKILFSPIRHFIKYVELKRFCKNCLNPLKTNHSAHNEHDTKLC